MSSISELARLAIRKARRGDLEDALRLARRALAEQPNDHGLLMFVGTLHARRAEFGEAVANFRAAVRVAPSDPIAAIELIRALVALGQFEQAAELLHSRTLPGPEPARLAAAIARAYERQNRLKEAEALVGNIQEPVIQAQLAFRRGQLERALQLAESAPPSEDPGEQTELLARIHDRLGHSRDAFAAFTEMNRHIGIPIEVAESRSRCFRERLEAHQRQLSREWLSRWKITPAPARSPAFILGFPRSGTTLLETFLMGHQGLCVADEKPMLDRVARSMEGVDLAAMDEEVQELRQLYFDVAAEQVSDLGDRLLVDKQPFATIETPLIHRLFPGARLVFVERHPCDVVLSCFFARFQPHPGLVNFTTLAEAARLYDAVMHFWFKCRELLPLTTHELRYERLVAEPEPVLRAVLTFLDRGWDSGVLDHAATAAARGFISTPSYAQVTEPLNDRSIGRWKRYREQMAPVMPILFPWVERMGYEL